MYTYYKIQDKNEKMRQEGSIKRLVDFVDFTCFRGTNNKLFIYFLRWFDINSIFCIRIFTTQIFKINDYSYNQFKCV